MSSCGQFIRTTRRMALHGFIWIAPSRSFVYLTPLAHETRDYIFRHNIMTGWWCETVMFMPAYICSHIHFSEKRQGDGPGACGSLVQGSPWKCWNIISLILRTGLLMLRKYTLESMTMPKNSLSKPFSDKFSLSYQVVLACCIFLLGNTSLHSKFLWNSHTRIQHRMCCV